MPRSPFAAKKKPKSKVQLEMERGIKKRQKAAALRQRCATLYMGGATQTRIASEMGVNPHTVSRWLKEAGIRKERNSPADEELEPEGDSFERKLEETTQQVVDEAISLGEHIDARDAEDKSILELAQNQASPADQYQAYVASMGIKMLRDNILNIRGPRTVRELAELDQLIRRSMGLNPKGEGRGGGGSLTIDINILNNTKAATVGKQVVVEAETIEDEDDYEHD